MLEVEILGAARAAVRLVGFAGEKAALSLAVEDIESRFRRELTADERQKTAEYVKEEMGY